jgi:hypothetical protein
MPWWAVGYLVVFGVIAAAGVWEDFTRQRPLWIAGGGAMASVTVGGLFAGFWLPEMIDRVGRAAPVVFVMAATWEFGHGVADIRRSRAGPDSASPAEVTAGTMLGLAVIVPVYVVAGLAVFR